MRAFLLRVWEREEILLSFLWIASANYSVSKGAAFWTPDRGVSLWLRWVLVSVGVLSEWESTNANVKLEF